MIKHPENISSSFSTSFDSRIRPTYVQGIQEKKNLEKSSSSYVFHSIWKFLEENNILFLIEAKNVIVILQVRVFSLMV